MNNQQSTTTPISLAAFRNVQQLHKGEFCTIYVATPPEGYLDREVVTLKISHTPAEEDFHEIHIPLEEEAQLGRYVQHPNILEVIDFLSLDGSPCLVREHAEGETLAAHIDAQRMNDDPLDEVVTCRIIAQVSMALDALHQKGLTHANVCPENILVDSEFNAYLFDLGHSARGTRYTSGTGGNPHYQSPQTVLGMGKNWESDIFQLGVILYEMLTLTNPFAHDLVFDTFTAYVKFDFPNVSHYRPNLHPDLQEVVHHVLAPKREHRIQSAAKLADAMQDIHDDIVAG